MKYIKIPVKSFGEGIAIAENIFGSMEWTDMNNGSCEAHPPADENRPKGPIVVIEDGKHEDEE